jgi:hypothetical protein
MAEKTLYTDGDNKQLRDAIFKATPLAVTQTKKIANQFKGKTELDTCRNIFNYLLTSVTYKEDGSHQKIKVPSALMRERQADCKSYALFTAGILQNLGIGWKYCLTSYNNDPTPQHIYVVTDSGIIIDAVWKIFNEEKKPNYKFYHKPDLTDMKISYIAGIGARSSNYQKRRMGNTPLSNYPTNNIGSNTLLGAMNCKSKQVLPNNTLVGIGRTGYEWLKAATGREATAGEIIEYGLKNGSLMPARAMLEKFISNNGGGIANFLYNAWLRNEAYYLPNEKKYQAELLAGDMAIEEKLRGSVKTWQIPADALKRYQDASQKFQSENPNATFPKKVSDFYTPEQKQARIDWEAANKNPIATKQKLKDELKANLQKKYPEKTRMILPANDASRKAFRDLELAWFWKLGGSPDDLNNAIKEGNSKSPRGRDANYLLNKMFNGNLQVKDIGLIIRAFTSAFAGDRFGLGDEGTYLISIHGTKSKGIGFDPATATATITAYTPAVLAGLAAVGAVLKAMKDAGIVGDVKTEETSTDGTKSDYLLAIEDGWSETKPTDGEFESKTVKKLDGTEIVVYRTKIKEEEGEKDSNTTTYIVVGAAALGLLYFLSKK